MLDRENTDAGQQYDPKLLVQILIEYSVHNSLLGQQWVIKHQQLLGRRFIPSLGGKEQFFEVHPLSPRISFCTFWSAR